ncbi:hypothetical protein [Chryseobacterium sp.]|uniref:hypothetical protein n=1 Tax=Chryseobacterium sp. TaxID=1871047 RepID=UPI0012A9430B|nr:hypothetical protein [Chryseobacterium sp.]QFG53186.1 hypothetical protein F7R58_06380 [Chryseobacterium sp.]
MQNSFSQASLAQANWYDSIEEARAFICAATLGMEVISPKTLYINYPGNVKFVESLAFIELTKLMKHEFVINVSNGIFEVKESRERLNLFDEYCRWGHFEKFKSELKKPGNSRLRLQGFLSAIYGDQAEIVAYFIQHTLFPVERLYNSPLYECVRMDSVNSFHFLAQHFQPQEQLLPYILERDALAILKYILATPSLMDKMTQISQEDLTRIQRDMTKPRFDNQTMKLFKEKFRSALALHN